jgi:hypothetical protein
VIRGGMGGRLTKLKKMTPVVAPKRVAFGPLVGMRDSSDSSVSNDPKYARLLQNVMPIELDKPSTMTGRPGFDKILSTQLGTTSGSFPWTSRTGQLVHHFVREDGNERTLIWVGGHLYNYNPTLDSSAEVTAGSVTWDQTARYYAVTFGDTVVYHDGTNTPRTKEPIANSGVELTNAPVFYGQPVVYYAKVFAIKSTERSVIVWSEENDPTIGYEAVPYSNSWQLGQTDQEPLYALAATNEALYYFRARSIGTIRGAVTPEFTTDGTHEGISQSVGTVSPDGVCVVGSRVFFIDADARPHVIDGGQAIDLSANLRETLRGLDKTKLDKAITRYDPTTGLVLFGVVEIGQSEPSVILAINPVLNLPVAVWRGFSFSALGIVRPALSTAAQSGAEVEISVPALLHLHNDGYAYLHGTPNGAIWDDLFDSGTVAIQHVLESCHLATDPEYEKRFSRADILLRVAADISAITVTAITPHGTGSDLSGSVNADVGSQWDAVDWDEGVWESDFIERHLAVGLNQVGRWARLRMTHQVTGERIGFTKLSADYTPAGNAAGAP